LWSSVKFKINVEILQGMGNPLRESMELRLNVDIPF